MKNILIFISLILLTMLTVNAVPQAIFSYTNITITGNGTFGNYHLWGEGVDATETFAMASGNCTFSYLKYQIPVTFSRDFGDNETDFAFLLNELRISRNATNLWVSCIQNLTECKHDLDYESNYSTCSYQLDSCTSARDVSGNDITNKNDEISTLKQHRLILGVIATICALAAWNFYNKQRVRTIQSPMNKLPSVSRM